MFNQLFNALTGLRGNLSLIMQPMLLFESLSFSLRYLPLRSGSDLIVDIGFVPYENQQSILQARLHVLYPHSLQITQRLCAVIIKRSTNLLINFVNKEDAV